MRAESFWNAVQDAPMLRGRITADVAIAGGGLSGLTCALWLSRAGLRVAVVEANELGSGSSAHCAGILTLARGTLYSDLEKQRGCETTASCAETLKNAMRTVGETAERSRVKWRVLPACITGKEEMLQKEAEAMQRAGISAQLSHPDSKGFSTEWMIRLEGMAIIHTGEYLKYLADAAREAGARLYAHSRVNALEIQELHTSRGSIQAPYLIVSTGYPILNFPGWYFSRIQQYDCQLIPLTGSNVPDAIYQRADGRSALRPTVKGALMVQRGMTAGSGEVQDDKTRTDMEWGLCRTGRVFRSLECHTADGLPFIGTYGRRTPNLFVASGYGGMGILGSMMAAQAIAARILGLPSCGYEIYSGQRSIGNLQVPLDIGGRYVKELLLHPSAPRCPHMGCRLVRNPSTRLWECPCHGSRFDDIGHVLNAPAVRDAVLQDRRS